MRRALALLLLLLVLLLAGGAGRAVAQTPVDLELVLAVDASGSVTPDRFELQKHGYAQAFRNPQVLQAIQSGGNGAIAVAMVQWTGPSMHVVVVKWTVVHDAASAVALADAIDASSRQLFGGGTSISGAIDFAKGMLANAPVSGARRLIDISGDGRNNRGRPATDARDAAVRQGVVINGLPILTVEPDLEDFYRDNVIGGAGSFVVAIDSYDKFADAILHKLITEISANPQPGGTG